MLKPNWPADEADMQIRIFLEGLNCSIKVGLVTEVTAHCVQCNPHGGLFLSFDERPTHIFAASWTDDV